MLEVDSTGLIQGRQPGTSILTALWAADTTLQASQEVAVSTIAPGALGIAGFRGAGSATSLPYNNLSCIIDVDVGVFVFAYFGGTVELSLGNTLLGSKPYPTGCPQRAELLVFSDIDTGRVC